MKKTFVLTSLFIVFCLLVPNQNLFPEKIDLVKLKKEEEERRKKLEKAKTEIKVITNETIQKNTSINTSKPKPQPASAGSAKPVPKVKKGSLKPNPKKTREYWVKRKTDLEKQIIEFKDLIEKGQLEYNRLGSKLFNTDSHFDREKIRKDRDEVLKTLTFDKKKLEVAKRTLDSLGDEARKAGVPQGWVR